MTSAIGEDAFTDESGTIAEIAEELAELLENDPGSARGWNALFQARYQLGDVRPAITLAKALISRIPDPESVFLNIARGLYMGGFHDIASSLCKLVIKNQPEARIMHSVLIGHLQLYGDIEEAARQYADWNSRFVSPLAAQSVPPSRSTEPDRPLRIGFLSNDFSGGHSLIYVLEPWFVDYGGVDHRQPRNELFLYSNLTHGSPPHSVFTDSATQFIDVSTDSDKELDARIRHDEIDILIDFISHSDRNRFLTYARKPAPIIVSWIGLGIPTGVETVDYLLADEELIPVSTTGRYTEKIAYLPTVSMVWHPPSKAPEIGPVPCLQKQSIVFGNLNRIVKFCPETIELWSRVLHRLPESKFLFKDSRLHNQNAKRILSMFARCGIGQERLIFRHGSSRAEHLDTYNEIDVVLDCFPQNGGISSLEALWMGVPVVSLCDPVRPSGRAGRFFLANAGLEPLVADSEEAFVNLAAELVAEPERLKPFRTNLRQQISQSPICDGTAFQRHISAAFRHMWKRYCEGLPPETFRVPNELT